MRSRITQIFLTLAFFTISGSCQSQKQSEKKHVGGRCEGCELMYEGMPQKINSTDTSLGWKEDDGQKFIITGSVFRKDGATPATDVILYYYHTDNTGKYTARADQPAKRHGYLRGWVKTDSRGGYTIYTIRPMHYPNETFAAHVHVFLKEPLYNEYYLDEWVFDDDRFLNAEVKRRNENRGGSGIMHAENTDGIWRARHNIVCGMNIPGYPGK